MNIQEYRNHAKQMVDYIADYLDGIRERRVFPDVKPGYMRYLLPDHAPQEGEDWQTIFADIERVIMPGVTHWQSPYMHAYFPALNCPASLLGDMLADAIGCLGFTWASSPAATELEIVVMDWLAKAIGLPEDFLHLRGNVPMLGGVCSTGQTEGPKATTTGFVRGGGGGVIQTTSSESTFVALLAARTEAIKRMKRLSRDHQDGCLGDLHWSISEDAELNSRLIAYASDQAHSSVEKAGLIGLVRLRYIESDDDLSLRGDQLAEAIAADQRRGLVPFFLCATLGTTGACAFDNLAELGPLCQANNIWLHVDAAYAGTAFICPEFRTPWLEGIEWVDSFAFNPSKWMMVHFDCTAMWVRRCESLHRTFNVEPLYLRHENSGLAVDFMHWQIPLSKRFRALKLWCVMRNWGISGLQAHIRRSVKLASRFEELVRADPRFEIPARRHLGMVIFRLKGENDLTEQLLKKINSSGRLHCVPASLKGIYVIRFTITSQRTSMADIERDWRIIQVTAGDALKAFGLDVAIPKMGVKNKRVTLADIKRKAPNFGTSLLLSNAPMTPKIVNGSFVAIFDNQEAVSEFVHHFGNSFKVFPKDSPALRRRIKGMLVSDKQYSLDSRMDLMNSIMAAGGESNPKSLPSSTPPSASPQIGKTAQECVDPKKNDSTSEPDPIKEEDSDPEPDRVEGSPAQ